MSDQSPTQSLRVVSLEDTHDLPRRADARLASSTAIPKVDQERERFLPRGRNVQGALEHVDQVLHLLRVGLCVLVLRQQVQAGPTLLVEAQDDLLARCVLLGDVLGREGVGAELAAPDECVLEPFLGLCYVPFGRAEVPEETLAGEPHAFGRGEGFLLGALGGRLGEFGPCLCCGEDFFVFLLLLLCEGWWCCGLDAVGGVGEGAYGRHGVLFWRRSGAEII